MPPRPGRTALLPAVAAIVLWCLQPAHGRLQIWGGFDGTDSERAYLFAPGRPATQLLDWEPYASLPGFGNDAHVTAQGTMLKTAGPQLQLRLASLDIVRAAPAPLGARFPSSSSPSNNPAGSRRRMSQCDGCAGITTPPTASPPTCTGRGCRHAAATVAAAAAADVNDGTAVAGVGSGVASPVTSPIPRPSPRPLPSPSPPGPPSRPCSPASTAQVLLYCRGTSSTSSLSASQCGAVVAALKSSVAAGSPAGGTSGTANATVPLGTVCTLSPLPGGGSDDTLAPLGLNVTMYFNASTAAKGVLLLASQGSTDIAFWGGLFWAVRAQCGCGGAGELRALELTSQGSRLQGDVTACTSGRCQVPAGCPVAPSPQLVGSQRTASFSPVKLSPRASPQPSPATSPKPHSHLRA